MAPTAAHPASHLAAWLGAPSESATLVGDEGMFLQGLTLAADWLVRGLTQTVVVVGAEELDGLVAGALNHSARGAVHAAGAGALCLRGAPPAGVPEVVLERVTDAFSYSRRQSPEQAAQGVRRQLPRGRSDEWLVLSTRGHRRLDRAELAAWADWPGPRVAPQLLVGTAFNAAAAWQVVLAGDAIRRGAAGAATISVVGTNQQAVGARLVAGAGPAPPAWA